VAHVFSSGASAFLPSVFTNTLKYTKLKFYLLTYIWGGGTRFFTLSEDKRLRVSEKRVPRNLRDRRNRRLEKLPN
jgi:hypothetical protein